MDTPDPTAEPAQPEGGQGGGGGDAPYAEYLQRIPESVRGDVEPVFKDWDANVTRRFQDHAQYREQWKPYEEAGVQNLSPDEVQWLMQFRQAHDENPQAIVDWARGYASERGLTLAEQQAAEQAAESQSLDEFGMYDPQAIEKALSGHLGPIQKQLEAMQQRFEQQEHLQRQNEAFQAIRGRVDELKKEHGDQFDEEALDMALARHVENARDPVDAVNRAWADVQSQRARWEQNFLKSKPGGAAPLGGGTADVNPPEYKTLEEAGKAALARLRQANQM